MSSDAKDDNDNVVAFPRQKIDGSPPLNLDEIRANMQAVREAHVYEALDVLISKFFGDMYTAGFDLGSNPEKFSKDIALFVESLSALLKKHAGLPHQLHKFAEESFTTNEDGGVIWTATGQKSVEPLGEDFEVGEAS